MYNSQLERDVSEMIEDFNIMDAASADYSKRQMAVADEEFERAVLQGRPECRGVLVEGHCTHCNQRGQ